MWFDSWQSIFNVMLAGVVNYAALVLFLRLSGKRTLSQFNAFDFIVTVSIGSVLASAILTPDTVPVATALAGLATLITTHYFITFIASRFRSVQKIIKSSPRLLMYDGEFIEENLRAERVTDIEILAALREQGLGNINNAQVVIMETNGRISMISTDEEKLSTVTSFQELKLPGKNNGKQP